MLCHWVAVVLLALVYDTECSPRVVGYVNTYGAKLDDAPYNILVLSFLYPNATTVVAWGGPMKGWQSPYTVSVKGVQTWLKGNPNRKVFASLGGADWKTEYWRNIAGKEKEFAQGVKEYLSKVTAVDQSGAPTPLPIAGVDLDYEDNAGIYPPFPPKQQYDGVSLLANLSIALKNEGFEVSHAPQGPYLCTPQETANSSYKECAGGVGYGYLDVWVRAGDHIDFLFVQYYNNPSFNTIPQLLDSYRGLTGGFIYRGKNFSIPAGKLVVGKPDMGKPSSGYIPVGELIDQALCPLYKSTGGAIGGAGTWKFTDGTWGAAVTKAFASGCSGSSTS